MHSRKARVQGKGNRLQPLISSNMDGAGILCFPPQQLSPAKAGDISWQEAPPHWQECPYLGNCSSVIIMLKK